MARVRNKDTQLELTVRSALHARGFRFRLHSHKLPGRPDLVLKKYSAVIFVHGCFWHGHNCHLFSWPKTRRSFWRQKIEGNVKRDKTNRSLLITGGWRVVVIWGCALKGRNRLQLGAVADRCTQWLNSDETELMLQGNETPNLE